MKWNSIYFKFYNVKPDVIENFKKDLKELNPNIKRILIDRTSWGSSNNKYKVLVYGDKKLINELKNNDDILKMYQKIVGGHGQYIPPQSKLPKGIVTICIK